MNDEKVIKAKDEAEAGLNGDGRVLLRKSGTEPLIRVMVEAGSDEKCKEAADISATPMFMEVYFLSSIASISVPPDEAPILNNIALPIAGRKMAYTSSIIVSLVRGPLSGTMYSSP